MTVAPRPRALAGWLAPALLSVAAHAAAVLGVVALNGLAQPPAPVALAPVELVFEAAPAATPAAPPPEPAAAAPPPSAPARAEAPLREENPVSSAPPAAARAERPPPAPRVKPVPPPEPAPPPRTKPEPPAEAAPALRALAEGAAPKARPPEAGERAAPQSASLPAGAEAAPPKPSAPGYGHAALGNPPPRYPAPARRRGLEGSVLLRVHVEADGTADRVEVLESSGHALLDRAARRAVSRWRFTPAKLAGMPVSGTVDVPVSFRLKD